MQMLPDKPLPALIFRTLCACLMALQSCQKPAQNAGPPTQTAPKAPAKKAWEESDCFEYYRPELPMIGKGVVSLYWNAQPDTMQMLKADKTPWAQLVFVCELYKGCRYPVNMIADGKLIDGGSLYDLFSIRRYLNKNDAFGIEFDYFSKESGYYEILINHHTGERAWIEASAAVVSETYDAYIDEIFKHREAEAVAFNYAVNPVRQEPAESSAVLVLPKDTCSVLECDIKEVRQDWMHVYLPNNGVTGWIRWRKGKEIWVEFLYTI